MINKKEMDGVQSKLLNINQQQYVTIDKVGYNSFAIQLKPHICMQEINQTASTQPRM